MGLSAPVTLAVEEAGRVVRELVEQECGREPAGRETTAETEAEE